jgi:hypothetical protein
MNKKTIKPMLASVVVCWNEYSAKTAVLFNKLKVRQFTKMYMNCATTHQMATGAAAADDDSAPHTCSRLPDAVR